MPRWIFALILLCLPTVLNAQWREASSEHFLLYSDGSEEELRETAAALESFDRLLRLLMDVKQPRDVRLKIFLVADREAVLRTTDGSDPQLAGYYTNNPSQPILVAPRKSTGEGRYDLSAREILFHEYAHHVMLLHSAGPHPIWYLEGLAEYYSTTRLAGDNVYEIGSVPPNRLAVLRETTDWIPLPELLAATGYGHFAGRQHLLYAQGWLLAHYLTQDVARRDQLQAYFRLVSEGMERSAAVDAAFGSSAAEFDRQLRDYARRHTYVSQRLHLRGNSVAPLAVRQMRPAEAEMIGFEIALRRGVGSAAAAAFLSRLDAVGKRHLDDPYAHQLFALATERVYGPQSDATTLARTGNVGPTLGGR